MTKENKYSLGFIAFLQAAGLATYCSGVAYFMYHASIWFKRIPEYFAPLLVLLVFTTSALISGIITLYYPFILVWQKKQTADGVKLVIYTAVWMAAFIIILLLGLSYLPNL